MAQSISHQQQQLLRDSWLTSVSTPSPPTPTTSALRNPISMKKEGKETIHSGQFMVSHFEAEAQDDEDSELLMPDLDENNTIAELNTCRDAVLLAGTTGQSNNAIVASNLKSSSTALIDISLAKLFKCMNLAYRQKLTSPKWNSFKGIRLRWKDKIRLNNLIWRCWHMQFILKKRTPVCQFASPLDVDLHSKPEAVVLEGKYWKRQFDVIKAEYMKWRKFYRNRGFGTNAILDTVSEIDIFDWSPATNDANLMSMDDYCWTADTLFSTINTPFPFPDPREIARAGIADFIQPSLGPLQPNLDDFMNGVPLQELINNHLATRLPSVPEEVSDDPMYRGDYDFPAIMGTEPMDSSLMQGATITDVTNSELHTQLKLSDPLLCGQTSNATLLQQPQNATGMMSYGNSSNVGSMQYSAAIPQQHSSMATSNMDSMNMNRTSNMMSSQSTVNQTPTFMTPNTETTATNMLNTGTKKRPVKERGSRSQISSRREPHNYDKTTPTQHQTNLYNQMLAQQGRNNMQQIGSSMTGINNALYNSTNFMTTHNVQTQIQTAPIQNTGTNYMNALNLTANNNFNLATNQLNQNVMNILPNASQQTHAQSHEHSPTLPSPPMKHSSSLLSLLSMKSSSTSEIDLSQADSYKGSASSHPSAYKPYPMQPTMKTAPINHQMPSRNLSSSSSTIQSHQMSPLIANRSQLNSMDKEMYRSKSLPMNSTLQMPVMRDESFAVPKCSVQKPPSMRIRGRSNSMISKQQHSTPSLQSAASEPMLKTLAQLLTASGTSSGPTVSSLQQSNVLATANVISPNEMTHSQSQQQQKIKPQAQFTNQFSSQFSAPSLSPDHKFLSSTGSSTGESLQRRVGHIHAEQKRRYNIKNGFDMLHTLIPQLQQNPNAKLSKAAMLQKGADYIRQLRAERDSVNQKMDVLRKERDALNNSLNHLHSVLPANGAPVARQRTSRVKELYNEYVRDRTLQNWKFWILGLIFEPLLNSYNTTVSVASMEELYRSSMIWVDQHCSLIEIRPAVSDKLRYLSTTTDILSEPPSTLQDEVLKAISNNTNNSSNLL